MEKLENITSFYRYLWEDSDLLIVTGDIAPVMAGREVYRERHHLTEDSPMTKKVLRRVFAATGLAAVSLAERESWGWSLSLSGSSEGYFLGIEPEGMMCAVVRDADDDKCAVVLQRQKIEEPMKQSHFEPSEEDPIGVVRAYFKEVEQILTRIEVNQEGRGVLIQSLPGGKFQEIADLEKDALFEFVDNKIAEGGLKPIGEVILFYECRCTKKAINDMMQALPGERRDELWGELKQLEVECPRCGREYVVKRNTWN